MSNWTLSFSCLPGKALYCLTLSKVNCCPLLLYRAIRFRRQKWNLGSSTLRLSLFFSRWPKTCCTPRASFLRSFPSSFFLTSASKGTMRNDAQPFERSSDSQKYTALWIRILLALLPPIHTWFCFSITIPSGNVYRERHFFARMTTISVHSSSRQSKNAPESINHKFALHSEHSRLALRAESVEFYKAEERLKRQIISPEA